MAGKSWDTLYTQGDSDVYSYCKKRYFNAHFLLKKIANFYDIIQMIVIKIGIRSYANNVIIH